MEALKIVENKQNIQWSYDSEADVLYISIGKPVKAEGIDIGDGTIVRVAPETNEVVGLTIINPMKRMLKEMTATNN